MAKNYQTGRIYHNWTKKEVRIVEKIDRRSEKGEDRENVDHVFQQYHRDTDGSRSWSF